MEGANGTRFEWINNELILKPHLYVFDEANVKHF